MQNFSQFITEPNKQQDSNTNEIVGVLAAGAVLSFLCAPLMKKAADGIGSFFSSLFGGSDKDKNKKDDSKKDDSKKDDSKKDDSKKDDSKKDDANTEAYNTILMLAKKANENDKNENEKKKNDALLKIITASSFDKDGNSVPLDKIAENMKDSMSPEQFEAFKKDMNDTYEKNKDNQDFKDALVKAKANIKPEDYDKMLADAKKEAVATLAQLDKEKKEIEEHEKQLKDIESQLKNADGDKKKELEDKQKELQQNPPQTIAAAATGVASGSSTPSEPKTDDEKKEGDKEPEKKEGDKEPEKKEGDKEPEKKEGDKEPEKKEGDKEPEKKEGDKEPEKKEGDKEPEKKEDKKSKEDIEAEFKQKSKDLEDEYTKKLDAETDKDKKKAIEDEWLEKEEALDKEKKKAIDSAKDGDKEEKVEKDEDGNILKQEEITDPDTGKKIKVVTHTGPRGGKFYYPDGAPKTPEHKVYLNESIGRIPLRIYLARQFR